MPTYDYQCKQCDHRWELFQSIKDKPIRKCPVCGKLKAQRMIGPGAGIIFRGSGFYQTDYRSESYKKAAKADSEKSSGGNGKSEGSGSGKAESGSKAAKSDS
jgi:putative FmdB family regulatory protein